MAEAIFSTEAGAVASIELQGSLPARITMENFTGLTAVIIDDIRSDQATNQQFNTSLADAVYMYVFGDQMGTVSISGKLFSISCVGGGKSGLEELFDYYKQNRASKRTEPVQVYIGDTVLSGFVTRVAVHASGAGETNRINEFTLQVSTLPDDTTGE